MKSISNSPESKKEKKSRLGSRLIELRDNWPVDERAQWCLDNGYNANGIRDTYLRGKVGSTLVAEVLIATIEKYMKENNIAA